MSTGNMASKQQHGEREGDDMPENEREDEYD
jgi:hypothetical protein